MNSSFQKGRMGEVSQAVVGCRMVQRQLWQREMAMTGMSVPVGVSIPLGASTLALWGCTSCTGASGHLRLLLVQSPAKPLPFGAHHPGVTQLFPSQLWKWHGVAMEGHGRL